ncbi:MAG: hypothetical protein ACXAAH_02635 [Promethearchaeota archaeon]|jgi:hypothetical protein
MIVSTELERNSHGLESCGICCRKIKQGAATYHEGFHIEIICPQCYSRNSKKDIELIANMFLAFGGYFGMLRDPQFPVNEMLKCFLKEIQANKGTIQSECLKIKLLHLALLHGATPEEFRMLDNDLLKYMYRF